MRLDGPPVGAILLWSNLNGTVPVPEGYAICNGTDNSSGPGHTHAGGIPKYYVVYFIQRMS